MSKRIASVLLIAVAGMTGASAWAAPVSYSCTDCPLPVPPMGTSGTSTSVISIADAGTISDLNVYLNLTHTFDGDLEIFVEHGMDSVLLVNNRGGSLNDFLMTGFDDQAGTSIVDGVPPFSGVFSPEESLSLFNGSDIFGDWTLRIVDTLLGDTGELFDWRLEFEIGDNNGGTNDVPEPSSLALLGLGLAGMGFARRRKKA